MPRFLQLFLLALSMAAALEMKVETSNIICEDLLVKMALTSACGDSSECQLGETQEIDGYFVYDGLKDVSYLTINSESSFVMDATLRLGVGQVTTIQYKLLDKMDVPVCSAFTASDYNKYGDCPADGTYTFSSTYSFPKPQSSFVEWAASGYDGQIDFKIYYDSYLVGRCIVQASTVRTEASRMPSGKIGAVVVATLVGLFLIYFTARCCARRRSESDADEPELLTEPTTSYNRFEAGGAVYEADYGGDFSPGNRPTRSFSNGPVI